MDSKEPSIPYRDFASSETRFSVLQRTHPEASERYLRQAQQQIKSRYRLYEQLAQLAMEKAES
jgi:pyruvate-ferredoxin/flavodoxin oxidoreductase